MFTSDVWPCVPAVTRTTSASKALAEIVFVDKSVRGNSSRKTDKMKRWRVNLHEGLKEERKERRVLGLDLCCWRDDEQKTQFHADADHSHIFWSCTKLQTCLMS